MIDLILAGDNSIVIAMAVQALPREKRNKCILFGALAAVLLRVIFTFCASYLLTVPLIKLFGGLAIVWIAIKLLNGTASDVHTDSGAQSVWNAIWMIIIADLTMSLDNILAVAGASHGSMVLLLFGLGLSIPLVVFASAFISKLMERFRWVVWVGALILGKVAGEMIITDSWLVNRYLVNADLFELKNGMAVASHSVIVASETICILFVLFTSILIHVVKSKRQKKTMRELVSSPKTIESIQQLPAED